jgi:hypothetical protein
MAKPPQPKQTPKTITFDLSSIDKGLFTPNTFYREAKVLGIEHDAAVKHFETLLQSRHIIPARRTGLNGEQQTYRVARAVVVDLKD